MYCYPHAGGSPGEYLRWEPRLPDIEILGILPPGRGRRLDQPPFTRAGDLVNALLREVDFVPPFLLFGHSLGALLAYETARALREAGRPAPAALIVSAHRPPDEPHGDPPIHDLPDTEFQAIVAQRYPIPPEIAEDPELLTQVHATLRSDLSVFETYRHPPMATITCPILVISGAADHWSRSDLAGWSRRTSAGSSVHLIDGDHYYLPDHPDQVIAIIAEYTARSQQ